MWWWYVGREAYGQLSPCCLHIQLHREHRLDYAEARKLGFFSSGVEPGHDAEKLSVFLGILGENVKRLYFLFLNSPCTCRRVLN